MIPNQVTLDKIELGLNDVLLIRFPSSVSKDNLKELSKALYAAFPDHAELKKIVFIDKRVRLEIVKTESIDDILLDKKGLTTTCAGPR